MSSNHPEFQSVTGWLNDLENGSDEAAAELWRRYFQKLTRLAKTHLQYSARRVSDEEDVAICVFRSLCEGVAQGRFSQLDDRDDLWKLLIVMTRHKSLNQRRWQQARKRGQANVRGHSIVNDEAGERGNGFDIFFGDDPTPDFLVQVEEEQQRLLKLLVEENHGQIAELRWQGYSVEETAEKLQISTRSVKRKLALIRKTWMLELVEADG